MKLRKIIWNLLVVLAISILVIGCSSSSSGNNSNDNTDTKSNETDYPNKSITFVVWSAAGSGVDVMARQAAKIAEEKLGQTILVENKTGGSGAIAMNNLLSKPADGYTVGANTRSQMISLNTSLKGQIDPESFEYIAQVQSDPYALVVHADSDIETVEDLIEAAKLNEKFSIGGFGATSAQSVITQDLAEQGGFPLNWVAYEGGSDAVTQLLGKHIDAAMTNVGQVESYVKSGDLRVLGVSTEERIDILSDSPTFEELGFGNMTTTHWRGFYVKKGTPEEVIRVLEDAFKHVTEQAEWNEYLSNSGLFPLFNGYDETSESVQSDLKRLAEKLGGQ